MAQLATEAVPELARFDENSSQLPMNGAQKAAKAAIGVAPGMASENLRHIQTQRPMMRPSREVELTLARLDPHLVTIHEMDPYAVSQFTRLATTLIAGSARQTLK
ncbi:MAG: hypothetical protein ACREA2_06595, partial [Blastocatellia bacterium]